MTHHLNRRTLLKGALGGVLAAPLASRLAFAQETRLRFFWWGNQDRSDRTHRVIDLYEAANPGVTVDGETAPFSDFWTRLATQVVGGNPPDIIQMDFRYIAEYADRGALLPLDDYLGNLLDLSEIPTEQVDANRVNGQLYGISFGVNCAALHINSDAWAEVGIEPPALGTTYEDFAEACVRLKEATPRDNFYGTSDASGIEVPFENFLRQRGRALYTADGELAFDETDAADWFALWDEMRKSGACVTGEMQASDQGTIETSMLIQGYAACNFGLANAIGPIRNLTPETIELAAYPLIASDAAPGHYLRPATRVSISAATPDPEQAVSFLAFFTQDLEAAKVLGAERGIPVAPTIQQAIASSISAAERASVEYIAAISDVVGPLPPQSPPGAGEITDLLHQAAQEVAFGVRSPQDSGSALVQGAADILARS
ncbi:ABC transporter substrate-binding protein [Devosia nitrariae]|uniref:Sugar ABC transporter substrate-binding protein n=1 Tax=Devosia nitrariae TaxID=2071872 RepID=A0ABQ5W9X3_9HYPH|nr:ABC transporter substrate-binding protein [Devosia nitrariae]GLQ56431.1 sugar ABC transporter substrate-binding protein [Devosia nitrariae]